MSAALWNILRSVQQKLLHISKVDGQPSVVVLSRWPRGVADVDRRGSGGRHDTGGKQRVDRRRAQIGCRHWRREMGQHGAWLTAGAQATIERRRTVGPKSSQTRDFGSYIVKLAHSGQPADAHRCIGLTCTTELLSSAMQLSTALHVAAFEL